MRATGPMLPFLFVAIILMAVGPALGQRLTFDTPPEPREIKACVLAGPNLASGYVYTFMGLQKAPIRPEGWSFSNPLAPTQLAAGMPRPTGAQDGWPILPTWPVYWQVTAGTGTAIRRVPDTHRLVGMDVILMPGNVAITDKELQDGLTQAVENGALLWIDMSEVAADTPAQFQPPRVTPTGGVGDVPNAMPFAFIDAPATVTCVAADDASPFFNGLFALDADEVNTVMSSNDVLQWPYTDANNWLHNTDTQFSPIALGLDNGGGVVGTVAMAAQYGSGTILVTTGNAAQAVGGWITSPGTPQPVHLAHLEFAYNAINWHFGMRQQAAAGGRAGTAMARAPLEVKWQYPAPNRTDPAGNFVVFGPVVSAPVEFDGRIYVATTRAMGTNDDDLARIVCLDARPERDLDGNGDADDGIVDYSLGSQYDVIWEYQLPASFSPKSSGLSVTAMDIAGVSTPVVLCAVTRVSAPSGQAGYIYCLNGLDGTAVWPMAGSRFTVTGYGTDSAVCDISTPVVQNGWVYFTVSEFDSSLPNHSATTDEVDRTYGRVWCIDLATGGQLNTTSNLGGAVWVFPDADLNGPAGPGSLGEPQRSLPCFNDPLWVAGVGGVGGLGAHATEVPPLETARPVITSGATYQKNVAPAGGGTNTARAGIVDAMIICGTPVTHVYDDALADGNATRVRTADWVDWQNRGGGSEFALVPTPMGGDGTNEFDPRLNRDYYSILLSTVLNATNRAWGANNPERQGCRDLTTPDIQLTSPNPAPTVQRVVNFLSVSNAGNGARQFLALWGQETGQDPLEMLQGLDIEVEIDPSPAAPPDNSFWEAYRLAGPVRWTRQYETAFGPGNEGRACSATAVGNTHFAPTLPPVDWTAAPPVTNDPGAATPGPTPTGLITAFETEKGKLRYRIDPRAALPAAEDPTVDIGTRTAQTMLMAAPAADDGTLVAAASLWQVGGPGNAATLLPTRSAVVGLKQEADLEIHLGGGAAALTDAVTVAPGSVVMHLIENLDVAGGAWGPATLIPSSSYSLDPIRRVVKINPADAHDVGVDEGATDWPNPISGKAVFVTWQDPQGNSYSETRLFDPGYEFTYVPGFVKLHRYPAILDTVRVYLPDDTPTLSDNIPVLFDGAVSAIAGEPTVNYNCTGAGAVPTLPNGWLDMRTAYVEVNGTAGYQAGFDQAVPYGTEVVISYTGYFEPATGWTAPAGYPYTPALGFTPIPSPLLGLSAEVHQIPVEFGQARSAPTIAGKTALVGALPFDPMWNGTYPVPGGATSRADTLLAINWGDRRGAMTWGRMSQPAGVDEDQDGIDVSLDADDPAPIVAPVTAATDGAIVGSTTTDGTTNHGYLSLMSTARTLICAGSRIVECIGSEPLRTITGYQDGATIRPFGQIAKATRLSNGNILVVDSGNNRVVEIDSLARLVWPQGPPASMILERPTDAWRYYTTGDTGERWTHTVIADAGHKRIIEVVTKPTPRLPGNPHEVYVVTPPSWDEWDGVTDGNPIELEYQTAQPILDPQTGHLWGYLASAANWNYPLIIEPPRFEVSGTAATHYPARINPPAGTPVLGAHIGQPPEDNAPPYNANAALLPTVAAGAVWDRWTFLYSLEFRNIRQVEYVTYGSAAFGWSNNTYAWVVASDYLGTAAAPVSGNPMGVWEFAVPMRAADPMFRYTRADYFASGQATVPLPNTAAYTKAYFPTCAKRLPDGSYIIANQAGAVDNLVPANLDPVMWSKALTSEVLRVDVSRDIAATIYPVMIYGRNTIPDPRGATWPEPLSILTYAERE